MGSGFISELHSKLRVIPSEALSLILKAMDERLLLALSAMSGVVIGTTAAPAAPHRVGLVDRSQEAAAVSDAVCPRGMLPDGNACVHLPGDDGDDEREDAPVLANTHRERTGRWAIYDQIPRRPDRPADYDAYRYPIPAGLPGGHSVVSGYDLDQPDDAQRRGRRLRAIGHGGVDLPDPKGTPVTMVSLDHQQGDADVVYVGPLFGTTLLTRHIVREAGQLRNYLLLFGHLDGVAPGLAKGARVKEGDVVGAVGDSGSPELVHLHLEARRIRDGVDVMKKSPAQLLETGVSVVCDPRNVLPLR